MSFLEAFNYAMAAVTLVFIVVVVAAEVCS
jgi:hypothetical protein